MGCSKWFFPCLSASFEGFHSQSQAVLGFHVLLYLCIQWPFPQCLFWQMLMVFDVLFYTTEVFLSWIVSGTFFVIYVKSLTHFNLHSIWLFSKNTFCVQRCACPHVCAYACVCKSEVNMGFTLIFLRSHTDPEHTDLPTPAGQKLQESARLHFPNTGITGTCNGAQHCTTVLEI